MTPETGELLQKKIKELGNLPAMPSILQSLGECLSGSPSDVNIDRVVSLISYDKSLAAQCLRMANSAFFRRRVEVETVRGAVLALGMWRVRDIVYSCTLPGMFSHSGQGMDAGTFWRHALGTAFVSQHFAQRHGKPLRTPHQASFFGKLTSSWRITCSSRSRTRRVHLE